MKKAIFVLLKNSFMLFILLLSSNLYSQEEFIFSTDNDSRFIEVREINDKYAALYYQSNELNEKWSGLMLFDEEFEHETIEWKCDTANILFQDFLITEENNILLSGTIKSLDSVFTHTLIFLLLDEELNMLNETVIVIPFTYENDDIRMLRTEMGRNYMHVNQFLMGFYYFFVEFNDNGDVLKQSLHEGAGLQGNSFSKPQNDTSFFIYQASNSSNIFEIVEVDTNLNYTITPFYEMSGGIYEFGWHPTFKLINDSTYIVATHNSVWGGANVMSVYRVSIDYQVIGEPIYLDTMEVTSSIGRERKTMDWKNPNKIYVASIRAPYNSEDNYSVTIINQNFEVLGQKTIVSEDYYYKNYSMLATESGGCIIVGTRIDKNEVELDQGYIAFFSVEDVITAAPETVNPNDSDYLLFPNPGKELTVNTTRKGVRLDIYNQSGIKVLESSFKDDFLNKVNTSSLSPGVYLCHFTDKYGNKEVKKWMKF